VEEFRRSGYAARAWRRVIRFCGLAQNPKKYPLQRAADLKGPKKKVATRYSLVVPCHNVEIYLDDFFHSIFAQTVDPECLEVVAVDDGSTDGTALRIKHWADRFPGRIRYMHQTNQGQAAARNAGLAEARGEWVSFPDSDDFLSLNYIEKVEEELALARSRGLSMISCNLIYFKELKNRYEDNHPLRYRFEQGRTVLPAGDLQDFMQLSAATVWFRRDLIERHGLRFDSRIQPTFEDGHFVNNYLLLNERTDVAFLRAPVYYYRKREDQSSSLDSAKQRREYYLDSLRYGYLDLLLAAEQLAGNVPRFIQRTVLYDILYRFFHLIDHPERAAFLTEEERKEFFGLLEQIFAKIDSATINTYDVEEKHKVGLLNLTKRARRPVTTIYVRQYDEAKQLVQFSYYSSDPHNSATVEVNDTAAPLYFKSRCGSRILDRTYFYEHFFWVALGSHDYVTIRVDGEICPLQCRETQLGAVGALTELLHALAPPAVDTNAMPAAIRDVRRAAIQDAAKAKYGACWLFFDRDDKADNNAEHLYRHLLAIGKADKAFFVLRTDSPDWQRLEREGFHLIAFNSQEHLIALVNARCLISSDIVDSVISPISQDYLRDLVHHRFVFLAHGVIKDDISRWLNSKEISLFVTSTPPEFASIANEESDYKFSAKEVVLTGLARHDSLLSLPKSAVTLLIMPTWRHYLAGKLAKVGAKRAASASFATSDYAIRWKSLLHSPMLRDLAARHGLKLVFCPHANLAEQLADLDLPAYVEVADPLAMQSLQPLFAETAVLVTDYSSVAFEMAYLEKPVVYYQFDTESFFSGGHTSQTGYFDYVQEGFGPVAATEEDLLSCLEATLSDTASSPYAERQRAAFPYRDGKCCERLYRSILALDEPRRDDDVA
jgi:glycosyltransferase involved in cell wall biosynthesis